MRGPFMCWSFNRAGRCIAGYRRCGLQAVFALNLFESEPFAGPDLSTGFINLGEFCGSQEFLFAFRAAPQMEQQPPSGFQFAFRQFLDQLVKVFSARHNVILLRW